MKYVEFGFGRLGQIARETPKTSRKAAGYDVLPLNTGTGDGHGVYTSWYPKMMVREADMTRWSYEADRNMWRRIEAA